MKLVFLTSLVFLFLFSLIPIQTQAALVPCGNTPDDPCGFCDFFVLINNVIIWVFKIVPVIAVLMLVIGGVMFFFGGAKPSLLLQAKGAITSIVIGLLIIFSAWVIVNTIIQKIGIVDQGSSIWQWYDIGCRQ